MSHSKRVRKAWVKTIKEQANIQGLILSKEANIELGRYLSIRGYRINYSYITANKI